MIRQGVLTTGSTYPYKHSVCARVHTLEALCSQAAGEPAGGAEDLGPQLQQHQLNGGFNLKPPPC